MSSGVRCIFKRQEEMMEPEVETKYVTVGSLLYSVEHRPWLPPDGQWLLSQRWNDALFAHFAMEPPTLRELVPREITLDLYDGVAWLTIVCLNTSHLRPSGVPPLPVLSFFPQLILRTYVTMEGKPGVYYFSVDATNLSAVWLARVFFRMQYWHSSIQIGGATIQAHSPAEREIHFRSKRLHGPLAAAGPAAFEVAYAPEGEAVRARPRSLDAFLMERYCLYTSNRGKFYRIEVHHQPWPLQQASVEIRTNSMAEPLGLALPTKPDFGHFSRSLKMLAWAPEKVPV